MARQSPEPHASARRAVARRGARRGASDRPSPAAPAGDTIDAIRSGAVVVHAPDGERVYALGTADQPYRTMVERMQHGAATLARDGTILFANPAFASLVGSPPETVVGRPFVELFPEEEADAVRRALERAPEKACSFTTRLAAAGGEAPVHVAASPIPMAPAEVCVIVTDLTERQRVQEHALRDSEERFRLATEALRGVVYDWDIASGTVARTAGLLDLVGYAPEETPAEPLWLSERVHPEDRERARHRFEVATAGGAAAFDGEYRVRHEDGRYVWVWDHARVIYDADGRPTRVLGCVISIDEQKRLQQALQQADRQKDRFLATLAHELRNPLAPIRNAVAVQKALGPATPELDWARSVVDRQVQHMARLLDDLLDVSRITQAKLQLHTERLELRRVLETALETTLPFIEESGHEIDLRLPDQPIPVDADPVRLSQVFANLLNNAAKYTDRGGRIWLRVEQRGATVAVSVRDTGIGISQESLPTVFDMFSQATPALERAQGGLGIGLSLVRGVVELHGGRVSARSDGPGKGSEFVVELPVAASSSSAIGAPPERADAVARVPKLRVLVADDSRDTTESLALMLTMKGHEVRTAFDGEEAFRAAESFRPDVALLDVGMPKASGHVVARRIRGTPWGARIVLVAQTGWGHEEDRRQTKEAGFDHHLVKPVSPDALANLLASIQVASRTSGRGAG